ncbi:hypothetical protein EVAR_15961_1 [Eumeta japonica]|uniref:Uncharacterized protein n=1 Tax=Eumeta variegata TaxID=151549 RepID=A0A4C1UL54_EUMVA|nr:hypothetical protein EVAR_15961_1 [Eumeta japonica]
MNVSLCGNRTHASSAVSGAIADGGNRAAGQSTVGEKRPIELAVGKTLRAQMYACHLYGLTLPPDRAVISHTRLSIAITSQIFVQMTWYKRQTFSGNPSFGVRRLYIFIFIYVRRYRRPPRRTPTEVPVSHALSTVWFVSCAFLCLCHPLYCRHGDLECYKLPAIARSAARVPLK